MDKKTKIIIDEPVVSSEEIKSRQNFESLASTVPTLHKPWYKSSWLMLPAAAAVITAASIAFWPGPDTKDNITESDEAAKVETTLWADANPKGIAPPMDDLDVPFSTYKANNKRETVFTHETGSEITIPAGAFIDRQGNEVKGDVRIEYREFHDVVDQVLCGIPMEYDVDGQEHTFQSAGMMQMFAYQGDERVFLNPDKDVNVKMRSYVDGDHFALYEYDSAQTKWEDIGKAKLVRENPEVEPTDDVDRTTSIPSIDEMTATTKTEKNLYNKAGKTKEEIAAVRRTINKMEKAQPIKPRKANANLYSFDLDVDPKEFPELEGFQTVLFEVSPTSKFDANFYQVQWTDIEIASAGTGKYKLSLWKGKTKKVLNVYPVFEKGDYDQALKKFDKKLEKYNGQLAERRKVEAAKSAELKALIGELNEQYEERLRIMEEQAANARKRSNTNVAVYRVFQIKKFGTYNCDTPEMWPQGANVIASYIDQNSNPLDFRRVVLVEKDRNMYFNLSGKRAVNFTYNPSNTNMIWGVTTTGDLAYTTWEEFDELDQNVRDKHDFKMNVVAAENLTPAKIKSLLNI